MKLILLKIFLASLLLVLLSLLTHELFFATNHQALPSALLNEPIPNFQLADVTHPEKIFTQVHLKGKMSLLNVFATWCNACQFEHDFLMKIHHEIPIYGIVYKDSREKTRAWLKQNGNPYVMVGDDVKGDTAIDLGVYGTPETFLLNHEGKIIYRHVGILTQEIWDTTFSPLIKKYSSTHL